MLVIIQVQKEGTTELKIEDYTPLQHLEVAQPVAPERLKVKKVIRVQLI